MANILEADILADNLAKKFDSLIAERNALRSELARKSFGSLEHDKAFVSAYQNGIIDNSYAALKTSKLEHLLSLR